MNKILITGSNGLLGQSLLDLYLKDKTVSVIAVSRGKNRYPVKTGYIYYDIDVTNELELKKIILQEFPNYIINTAAMTNVDACEDDKLACDTINVTLVENLVDICKEARVLQRD